MRNLFIAFIFFVFSASSQVMWQFNKDTIVTWRYEWGDEFNGSAVDKEKWSMGEGGGHNIHTNKERQYYTEGKNHVLQNGVLKLVVRRETVEGKVIDWMGDKDTLWYGKEFSGLNKRRFEFTSGKLDSRPLFNKGFFEVRFKAPADYGLWPAFWLYGGDPDEEIDIFELKGEKPSKVHVETHCPHNCDYVKTWIGKKKSWGGWINVDKKLTESYNIMACEWSDHYVKMFLNGKCIGYVPVEFNIPKTLQLNVAVPADDGPFHPGPKKEFTQSDGFSIDYVRVWTREDGTARKIPGATILTTLSGEKQGVAHGRPGRFLYGKKKFHQNEGPLVTLFPASNKMYVLYVLNDGKSVPVSLTLNDQSGQKVFSGEFNQFQNPLDFTKLSSGNYTLTIVCNSRTVKLPLQL